MHTAAASEPGRAFEMLRTAYESGTPFYFLISDAYMPEKSGFALVENIRKHPESLGATIVILTSAAQRGDAARWDLQVARIWPSRYGGPNSRQPY
jgi:CheY-like chemotaxis protein